VTTQSLRALVIGTDGVIGSALYERLSRRGHTVFGTTRRKAKLDSSRAVFLDLAEPQIAVDRLPDVDIAIICAAMARFADCRTQPDLARRVNVTAPAAIARRLVERGTFVVRLSSSAVFDCRIPHVHADHPTAPRSAYGRLQAEAEKAILGLGESASVLRLTKIITSDFALFRNWIAALAQGGSIEAFEDHTLCPLPLASAIDAATAVLEFRQGGIFQVSGAGDISYADLARYLLRCLGLPAGRVIPVRAADRGVPEEEVTLYTSMDTARLTTTTGFVPPEPLSVFDDIFGRTITRLYDSEPNRV
jgi:dTDP-4-dehydrorhamnose reductase